MKDFGLDLAVIGNGRTAALLEPSSRLVWWCYPRFDSDPVFCRLLAGDEEKGFTDVVLDGMADYQLRIRAQHRRRFDGPDGPRRRSVKITDFAPRFRAYDRIFRPPQLFRIIEPIAGMPRITIRFRPTYQYGMPMQTKSIGSNHITLRGSHTVIRLTTDAPLSYIDREAPFVLTRPVYLVMGPDEPFPADLSTTCREFADRTRDYWTEWVRRLSIAYDWQDVIIRAAITLKLSNFEETGGIIAAHTTSIPEAPHSGRTWDYRFCWLRDAYFVVKALNRIGATQTMEDFISFILGIASEEDHPPGLQHRADRQNGRGDRRKSERLPRRRTGTRRQRGGRDVPARHVRQHHSGRDADVFRPPFAAAGRRRLISSSGAGRLDGETLGLRAGCRHLGISRPHARAHALGIDVLGRVQSACCDRASISA